MDDNSLMPFGVHKDKKMQDVPSYYLLWLWEQGQQGSGSGITNKELKAYIEDNLDALKMEAKQKQWKGYM
jgi:uncharacterized protein (DUF3820 family)